MRTASSFLLTSRCSVASLSVTQISKRSSPFTNFLQMGHLGSLRNDALQQAIMWHRKGCRPRRDRTRCHCETTSYRGFASNRLTQQSSIVLTVTKYVITNGNVCDGFERTIAPIALYREGPRGLRRSLHHVSFRPLCVNHSTASTVMC